MGGFAAGLTTGIGEAIRERNLLDLQKRMQRQRTLADFLLQSAQSPNMDPDTASQLFQLGQEAVVTPPDKWSQFEKRAGPAMIDLSLGYHERQKAAQAQQKELEDSVAALNQQTAQQAIAGKSPAMLAPRGQAPQVPQIARLGMFDPRRAAETEQAAATAKLRTELGMKREAGLAEAKEFAKFIESQPEFQKVSPIQRLELKAGAKNVGREAPVRPRPFRPEEVRLKDGTKMLTNYDPDSGRYFPIGSPLPLPPGMVMEEASAERALPLEQQYLQVLEKINDPSTSEPERKALRSKAALMEQAARVRQDPELMALRERMLGIQTKLESQLKMDPALVSAGTRLADQFQHQSAGFEGIRGSLDNLRAANEEATSDNRQAHLAMIFSYMKMLDRISVVRESEQRSPQEVRSLYERAQGLYERVAKGNLLLSRDREDMLKVAQRYYDAELTVQKRRQATFGNRAKAIGVPVDFVVADLTGGLAFPILEPPGGMSPTAQEFLKRHPELTR